MGFMSPSNFNNFFNSKVQINWSTFKSTNFSPTSLFHNTTHSLNLEHFYFNFYSKFTLFIILFFTFMFYIFKNNLFLKSLSICEEEINSSDDFLLILSLVLFFFFFNFYGVFCFKFFNIFNVFLQLFVMLLISLVLMPLVALYNFGFYFIINIKGSGGSLSFTYELIQDNINLLSFFLRVYIQLVRLITIIVTYFGYNHLVLSYNFELNSLNSGFLSFLLVFARFSFELVHTIIIFIAQSLSLMMMILWLFQFLFTVFTNKEMELTYNKL